MCTIHNRHNSVRIVVQLGGLIIICFFVSAENMAHNSTIPLPDEGPDGGLLYSIKENTPLSRKYPQPYTESEDPLCSLSLESKRNLCFRSAQWFYNDMSLIRSDNTQLSCRLKVVQVESGSGILSLPIRALDCHVTIAYENDINHREIINFIVSAGPNRNSIFIHAIIERKIVPHVFIKNIQFNEF